MFLHDRIYIHILGSLRARKQQTLARTALLCLTRQYVVFDIVANLLFAAAVALLYGEANRVGAYVGIENNLPIGMTCRTTGYLRYRSNVTQETLLVGIEYRHQSHLGQIQALAQ